MHPRFADSPYETFVPVRFAMVHRADRVDDRLELDVRLGSFVRAGGAERLNELWGRFDREDDTRPGRVFTLEDDNPGILTTRSLDEQHAWRQAIDGLAANGYFDRSTLARVRRITDTRGVVIDDDPVRVGEPLRVELELRTPTAAIDDVGFFLDAEPAGSVVADETARLPATGTAVVEVTPTVTGEISLDLGVLPETLLSSQTVVHISVATPNEGEPLARVASLAPTGAKSLASSEIRALVIRLREATMSSASWFGLYEDVFLRWDGDDPVILTGFARTAYELVGSPTAPRRWSRWATAGDPKTTSCSCSRRSKPARPST